MSPQRVVPRETVPPPSDQELTAAFSSLESLLQQDPAGVYGQMDAASKSQYRHAVDQIARAADCDPHTVCPTALLLCLREAEKEDTPASTAPLHVRAHLGYYLVDDGRSALLAALAAKKRWLPQFMSAQLMSAEFMSARSRGLLFCSCYAGLTCILAVAATAFAGRAESPGVMLLLWFGILVLASHCANRLTAILLGQVFPFRARPRLEFSNGIPETHLTAIAIPSLLLDPAHVRANVEAMYHQYALTGERNVYVILLTDCPDSSQPESEAAARLVDLCADLVEKLNQRPEYADRQPFFLLHRKPRFSRTQGAWIGWERKRGKLQEFAQLVAEGQSSFHCRVGDVERLRAVRYVMSIDEDSMVAKHALRRLVSTHAHPLNEPYLWGNPPSVARGYAILQPGILGVEREKKTGKLITVVRSSWAAVYQGIFGRTTFAGKGLMHVHTYHALARHSIPEDCILSHDVIESGLLRTCYVPTAAVAEPPPPTVGSLTMRTHRWTRGDWQNLIWLCSRFTRRPYSLSAFGRLVLLENLRNSLIPVALTIVLAVGSLGDPLLLASALLLLAAPGYVNGILKLLSRNPTLSDWLWELAGHHRSVLFQIASAPHRALISADAILRTLPRLITKRRLLEWQTAAQAQRGSARLTLLQLYEYAVPAFFGSVLILMLASGRFNLLMTACLVLWSIGPAWARRSMRARIDPKPKDTPKEGCA
jgi:cyclic beta-1,2-glucan synthetase